MQTLAQYSFYKNSLTNGVEDFYSLTHLGPAENGMYAKLSLLLIFSGRNLNGSYTCTCHVQCNTTQLSNKSPVGGVHEVHRSNLTCPLIPIQRCVFWSKQLNCTPREVCSYMATLMGYWASFYNYLDT